MFYARPHPQKVKDRKDVPAIALEGLRNSPTVAEKSTVGKFAEQ
jgi:hypothetical protein